MDAKHYLTRRLGLVWLLRQCLVGVALAALSASPAAAAPERPANRPNVVIVLTDDQGYGDLSCHGNPVLKTPNLDRLHDAAVRFTDFHVAPICTPTRSQLLTGVDNLRNRACQWGYGLEYIRRDVPTIAEIFAKAGYRTGHFGKWHLGDNYPHRPSDRGFQESVRYGGAAITQTPNHWDNDAFDDSYWHNDVMKQYRGYCTDVFFNEAMRMMKADRDTAKPFLVYLALPAAHDPCFVADKYRQPYMHETVNGRPLEPSVHSFYGQLANFDENMGRLDAFLAAEGLRDNTIVIFMSDNGAQPEKTSVYNAGMRGSKSTLWEGGHRQSCFIRWPAGRLRPAGDVAGLTEIQDLLPTLMDLCGVEKPAAANFDGISLAPLLRGQAQDLCDRMIVIQYARGLGQESVVPKDDAAVLWGRWRLVGGRGGFRDLHNLDSDPAQQHNVIAEHPEIVEKMRTHYEAWWRDLQPALSVRENFHIGNPADNPTLLTCFDYVEHRQLEKSGQYNVSAQADVRRGMHVHGKWRLVADAPGKYRVTLRRWPAEADTPITAGLPMQKLTDPYPEGDKNRRPWQNTPLAGKALPVARIKIRFAGAEQASPVRPADKAVALTFVLPVAGDVELETWMLDADGQEIGSAPYAEIERLKGE